MLLIILLDLAFSLAQCSLSPLCIIPPPPHPTKKKKGKQKAANFAFDNLKSLSINILLNYSVMVNEKILRYIFHET